MMVPRTVPSITGGVRRVIDGRIVGYRSLAVGILGLVACASFAFAAPNVYSDGSDGAFAPTAATTTIDLGLAATGNWETTPGNGNGVYDPEKWAVVFKYVSVNIASGKTVTFINHPSGAPVVWLVQGDITIVGTINVSGAGYNLTGSFANAGPGGFAGGRGRLSASNSGSAGLGPGGGGHSSAAFGSAGYGLAGNGTLAGIMYGNARILPLIGGSGGGGSENDPASGGGGGGAILLASQGAVSISGFVNAGGGAGSISYGSYSYDSGGGSGGGIRIIANSVVGAAGGLQAQGGGGMAPGSVGRIRVEANTLGLTGSSGPDYTWLSPLESDTAVLWLPDTAPRIHVVTVGSQTVPDDPLGQFNPPGDVLLVTTDPQPVVLQAYNVPTDLPGRWLVKLRVTQRNGTSTMINADYQTGDVLSSTWLASLTGVPLNDFVAVQARASAQ